MERGWDAAGLLAPLWDAVGGRDGLARATGIQPATISGYNTGRLRLGLENARKIIAVLAKRKVQIGLADLGAPERVLVGVDDRRVVDRLQQVEVKLGAMGLEMARIVALVDQAVPATPRVRPRTGRGRKSR